MDKRSDVLPIDRGWAWVVAISACSLFGMQAGEFKVQGALLVELTERFEGVYPTSTLILVFTMKYALAGLLGPVVGFLMVKLTHRVISLVGVSLAVVGYIGLAYASSPAMVFFLHGVPSGIGHICIFLSALLVTGQYFNKRKALALGLTAAGSGIGQITLPYIYRFVFDNYDFRGACILLAGFSLQFLVPACLYRPMSYYEEQLTNENAVVQEESILVDEDLSQLCERESSFFHSRRLLNPATPEFPSCDHIADQTQTSPQEMVFIEHSSDDIATVATEQPTSDMPVRTPDGFIWKVIILPKFIVFSLAIFAYQLGICGVFQGIPALAKESGVSKQTVALAITIAGCLEIPCRIANGLLADKKIVTNTMQFTISLMIPGVMCLLCAIISGLPGIALVLIGMASVGTSVFSILPVVLTELIGSEYVTSGMSVKAAYESLAFISSSFIIGTIYDLNGKWTIVYFYIGGVMLTASAIMWSYLLFNCCTSFASPSEKKDNTTPT